MTFKMQSLAAIILTGVSLTACGTTPTQWMPNGYKYQDNTPLSSPAPSRPWVKEAANPSIENIGDNTASWQGAVYELISPLPSIVPQSFGAVSLQPQPPVSTATSSFDHYLRQALMSYAYTVNPGPGGAVLINYKALPLDSDANLKLARAKFGNEAMTAQKSQDTYFLTIDVTDAQGKLLTQQATLAILPYEKKVYSGQLNKSVQGQSSQRKAVYDTRD